MDNTALQLMTIVAIVLGPILALWIQRGLDSWREKDRRKLMLFQNLLTSRAMPLSVQHIQALNSIELDFYPRKGKNARVVDAWRIYSDHLNTTQPTDQGGSQQWETRRQDLLVDLLYEMSQSLGYDFDKVMIKRNAYYPTGLGNVETELNALRQAVLRVFQGNEGLRVRVDPT